MSSNKLSNLNKDRILYFDFLKVISCIAVIFIHATGPWSDAPPRSFDWISSTFYVSISRWSVPVFFMISGALLLGNSTRLNIKRLYKKNIFRFCIATIFWSAVYAAFDFISNKGVRTAIDTLIGGSYHMWFMFIIISLYMLAPILSSALKDEKILNYSLIILSFFPFLKSAIGIILSPSIPYAQFLLSEINGVMDKLGFITKTEYIFYFILGYYLHNTTLRKKTEKILIISGIFSLILTFLLTVAISFNSNFVDQTFHDATTINVLLSSISIFLLAKKYIPKNNFPELVQKVIIFVSNHSFGVYLSHALVLELSDYFGITNFTLPAIIFMPLFVVTILIFSIIISFALSNIPFLKKWII